MRGDAHDLILGHGCNPSVVGPKVGLGKRRIYIPRTEAAWNALTGKTLVEAWLFEEAATPTPGIINGSARRLFDIGTAGNYAQGSPWAGELGLENATGGYQAVAGDAVFGEPSDDSFVIMHGHFPTDPGGNDWFVSKHDGINHGWLTRIISATDILRWQVQDTAGAHVVQLDLSMPLDTVGTLLAGFSKTNGIAYIIYKTNGRLYSLTADISAFGTIDNGGFFKTALQPPTYPVRFDCLAFFNGAFTLAQAKRLIARSL